MIRRASLAAAALLAVTLPAVVRATHDEHQHMFDKLDGLDGVPGGGGYLGRYVDWQTSHCSIGQYATVFAGEDESANPAYAGTDRGSFSCHDCPRGKYDKYLGECSGEFCRYGAATCDCCMECTPGKYSYIAYTGLPANDQDPTKPVANAWGTESEPCHVCPVHKYSLSSAHSCSICPAGQDQHTPERASCDNCPAGQWSMPGQPCVACDKGKYSPGSIGFCHNCPPDTYVDATGSDALNDCISCPEGKYAKAGSPTCNLGFCP